MEWHKAEAYLLAWARERDVHFVNRSYGPYTTGTVSREALIALINKVGDSERAKTIPPAEGL
jgi:hypothetical protein